MEFLTKIVELHPILYRIPEHKREQISILQYCIMSASHSKIVVDHKGDLYPSKEPNLLLDFLLLKTDLLLELGIQDDVVQCRSNLPVQHFKVWKIFSLLIVRILVHPKNQPSPLLENQNHLRPVC